MHDRPTVFPDKFQFLASDGFPPFVFRDAEGRLTGFNVDLARALCVEMKSSCSLQIKDFDALLPALEGEEGDAIISGLSRSSAGHDKLLFTDDYLKLPARFMVRAGDAVEFNETNLDGRKVAVIEGTRHEAFLKRFWPGAEPVAVESAQAAQDAVRSGEVYAHFGDGLQLSFWMPSDKAQKCCRFAGGPWLEPGYFDEGLSIATRRSEPDRTSALNYALRQLYLKGVYKELYLRYFPLSFY